MISLFKKKPLIYGKEDMRRVEDYIQRHLGNFDEVFHELESPDIHIDIVPIPPAPGRDYLTLVTMGMGAYRMQIPSQFTNYVKNKYYRAELAIRLPGNWDTHSRDDSWFWPFRVLYSLARLPLTENSWLGLAHTVDFGSTVTDLVGFSGFLLDFLIHDDSLPVRLTAGDGVLMYNVVPIYPEEMALKVATNAQTLMERLGPDILSAPVDIHRVNRCRTD